MEPTENDQKFSFKFKSEKQALKAAKRLQEGVERATKELKTLGWAKNALAWVCVQKDYKGLTSPCGDTFAFDQDIADVEFLLDRRTYQASILEKHLKIDHRTALSLANFAEPTGTGSTFRFLDFDTCPVLQYQIPEFRQRPDKRRDPFILGSREENEYGLSHIAFDDIFEFDQPVADISLEVGKIDLDGQRTVAVFFEGDLLCRFVMGRSAAAFLYEDEPRILRPTEVRSLAVEWSLSEFILEPEAGEEFAIDLCAGLIATDMLQCATWCCLDPRPAVIDRISMFIECYDDEKNLAGRVAFAAAQAIDVIVEGQKEYFGQESTERAEWFIGQIAVKMDEVEVEI
jgi:hypothetical protein